mmetsp:Transcript_17554/g.28376  ORF Transcript_17554/g.28376 Transcript_17554/m.28376 type:complete len:191 (-) Transcript_17554:32-604(-)
MPQSSLKMMGAVLPSRRVSSGYTSQLGGVVARDGGVTCVSSALAPLAISSPPFFSTEFRRFRRSPSSRGWRMRVFRVRADRGGEEVSGEKHSNYRNRETVVRSEMDSNLEPWEGDFDFASSLGASPVDQDFFYTRCPFVVWDSYCPLSRRQIYSTKHTTRAAQSLLHLGWRWMSPTKNQNPIQAPCPRRR